MGSREYNNEIIEEVGTVNMGIRTSKGTVQVQELGTWYSKYGEKNE